MSIAPETVRSPADVDDPDDLEREHVYPSDLGEVTVENPEDGQPQITVPISSTAPHRSDGKIMTEEALEAMAEQLQSGEIGLWDDHGLSTLTGWREYRREDMYGKWVDGEVQDEVLWGTAELMEDRDATQTLLNQLDQDMPVGFSVGYKPLEEEMLANGEEADEKTRHIFDVDLWETSPVGIPDNPNAIAMAGAIEAELDRADVGADIGPAVTSTVATSVREALESAMTDTSQTDSTDTAGESPAGSGTTPPQAAFTEDEVEEIMGIVGGALESGLEDALTDIREELLDSDGGGDDDGDDGGDEESMSVDVGQVDSAGGDTCEAGGGPDPDADVDANDGADQQSGTADDGVLADLQERLGSLEERNQELEERLEEKEAKIDRLESETRDSAGRKGISPAAAGGDGGDEEGDQETRDAPDDKPTNALDEAMRLGGQ